MFVKVQSPILSVVLASSPGLEAWRRLILRSVSFVPLDVRGGRPHLISSYKPAVAAVRFPEPEACWCQALRLN